MKPSEPNEIVYAASIVMLAVIFGMYIIHVAFKVVPNKVEEDPQIVAALDKGYEDFE